MARAFVTVLVICFGKSWIVKVDNEGEIWNDIKLRIRNVGNDGRLYTPGLVDSKRRLGSAQADCVNVLLSS